MQEIKDAPLTRCNKTQHVWFMTAFNQTLVKYNAIKTEIGVLYKPFTDALAVEAVAVENESGSAITGKMGNKKDELNELFIGFTHLVKNGLNHFDQKKREAAEYIYHIINKYGSLSRKSNIDRTANIRSICNELLSAEAAPYVAALTEASEWITRIRAANEDHDSLFLERNAETSSDEITSLEARETMNPLYKRIVRCIQSLADLNGADKYTGFINEVNGLIDELKTRIDTQATIRRKQNTEKDSETIAK